MRKKLSFLSELTLWITRMSEVVVQGDKNLSRVFTHEEKNRDPPPQNPVIYSMFLSFIPPSSLLISIISMKYMSIYTQIF